MQSFESGEYEKSPEYINIAINIKIPKWRLPVS
jgi:hypothetical protein